MTKPIRWGRVAAGAFLLALSVALVVAALTVEFPAGSRVVSAGSAWTVTLTTDGSVAATVTWSGGFAGTRAYVAVGASDCGNLSGVVASGTGPEGSVPVRLSSGTTYAIFACSGTSPETATFTLYATGLPGFTEPLEVGAAIAAFAGGTLVFLGVRPSGYGPPGGVRRRKR